MRCFGYVLGLVFLLGLAGRSQAQAPVDLAGRLFYTAGTTATVGLRIYGASAYLLHAGGRYTQIYHGGWDLTRDTGGWQPTIEGTYEYARTSALTAVLRLRTQGAAESVFNLTFTNERYGVVEPPPLVIRNYTFWLGTPGTDAPLVNTALRAVVSRDAPVIAGFVVGGPGPRAALVRAVGPGLSAFGVARALRDPKLTIPRLGARFGENDNWADAAAPAIRAVENVVGAFPLTENSRDAAIILPELTPGAYTVEALSADGSDGEVLIEVYLLP